VILHSCCAQLFNLKTAVLLYRNTATKPRPIDIDKVEIEALVDHHELSFSASTESLEEN